jgi:hypothetical protein
MVGANICLLTRAEACSSMNLPGNKADQPIPVDSQLGIQLLAHAWEHVFESPRGDTNRKGYVRFNVHGWIPTAKTFRDMAVQLDLRPVVPGGRTPANAPWLSLHGLSVVGKGPDNYPVRIHRLDARPLEDYRDQAFDFIARVECSRVPGAPRSERSISKRPIFMEITSIGLVGRQGVRQPFMNTLQYDDDRPRL